MLLQILATDSDWVPTLGSHHSGHHLLRTRVAKGVRLVRRAGIEADTAHYDRISRSAAIVALAAVGAEFVGGVALILGFLARISALGIAVNMLAAIFMVHGKYGLFMNWFGDRKGHGIEYHLLAIALAIVIIAKGAGAFSLDGLLSNWIGA
jgi:putative oxidoreductase